MRIIVCGGRDYGNRTAISRVLLALDHRVVTIVHGDCPTGADAIADELAGDYGWGPFDIVPFPADWKTHGKAAGPIRNQQMLDAGADLVIAFGGGKGTADMVERARKAVIVVLEVS